MIENRKHFFPLCRPFPHRALRWQPGGDGSSLSSIEKHRRFAAVRYICSMDSAASAGKKLMFLSDIHWNNSAKDAAKMDELIQFVQIEKPDYLLLGGDQCGDAETLDALSRQLKRLAAAAPLTLAVNGNWECGKDWLPGDFWHKFYAGCGIHFLENASFIDQSFCFTGVSDISRGDSELPEMAPKTHDGRCSILLAHSPDTVIALDSADRLKAVSLILCGHTHGGQIRLPFAGSLRPRSIYGRRFDLGILHHSTHAGLNMIISAGMGELSFPLRFNCRREVTIITTAHADHGE